MLTFARQNVFINSFAGKKCICVKFQTPEIFSPYKFADDLYYQGLVDVSLMWQCLRKHAEQTCPLMTQIFHWKCYKLVFQCFIIMMQDKINTGNVDSFC